MPVRTIVGCALLLAALPLAGGESCDDFREPDRKWWQCQSYVAALAPEADRPTLTRLVDIVDRMRHKGTEVPYTALLALVDRIDVIAEEEKTHCWVGDRAAWLLYGYGLPRIPNEQVWAFVNEMREYPMWDPDTHENVAECDIWIEAFRRWRDKERPTLAEGAAKEREAIAKANQPEPRP